MIYVYDFLKTIVHKLFLEKLNNKYQFKQVFKSNINKNKYLKPLGNHYADIYPHLR